MTEKVKTLTFKSNKITQVKKRKTYMQSRKVTPMQSRVIIMITFQFSRIFLIFWYQYSKKIYGRSSSVSSDCGENWSISPTIEAGEKSILNNVLIF